MAEKSLKPLPYYKWFWQDYRANRTVQRMNYIERGLYRELLDECWVEGSIPNSIPELAEICGCPEHVMADAWHVLSRCFVLVGDRLHNEKIDTVRTEKDAERASRARAGQKGGASKSLINKDSVAHASTCLTPASTCHIEEKRREENKNPPNPPMGERAVGQKDEPAKPSKRKPRTDTTLQDWLTSLDGEDAIQQDDTILQELTKAGVPEDFQVLYWQHFKRLHIESGKRQKDWRAAFRNAVRGNWYKLWWFTPEGECRLTTAGEQARRAIGE